GPPDPISSSSTELLRFRARLAFCRVLRSGPPDPISSSSIELLCFRTSTSSIELLCGTYLSISRVKHILLSRVVTEDDGNVRISLCRTIGNAFTVFGGENGWPELSVFINQCVEVDNDLLKETAMLILANLLEQSTNVATRDESTFILEMLLGLLIHKPLDDRTKNLVKQTLLRSVEREDDRNVRIRLLDRTICDKTSESF
ncbi:importin-5-like protein isoform X1, partial [Tanacetum coccineum]